MSTHAQGDDEKKRLERRSRNRWVGGIVGGLGLVVVANVVMVSIATKNRPILEADEAYKEGLKYQDVIDERARVAELGWKVHVEACPEGAGACTIAFEVRDREGQTVGGLTGEVRVERLDDAASDRSATLTAEGPGRYTARVDLRRAGRWRLRSRLEGGPVPWVDERFIEVRPPEVIQ